MKHVDEFWQFMIARETIRLKRLRGEPPPWSDDWIFQMFSFTNVKRHHDRTTMLLDREFYGPRRVYVQPVDEWATRDGVIASITKHPSSITLINAAIFRFHGTIDTARDLGWTSEWSPARKAEIITKNNIRMACGERVFTAAYIVPNCGDTRPKHEVVADIVDSIAANASSILDTDSWAEACRRLCMLWGVGSFMAKEVLLDYILATGWRPSDWETWTPVGPGGRRGAGYVRDGVNQGIPEDEALDVIRSVYADRDQYWPKDFVSLDLTDIQFQFCEVAKYVKAKTNTGRPKSRFRPTVDDVTNATIVIPPGR